MAHYSSNSKRGTGEATRIAAEKRQTKAVSDWLATSGTGPDYRPWLKVQTVPSHGRAHRLWSRAARRELHVFSDIEAGCARIFDWTDDVVDIREQYPLLPVAETEQIADAIGVQHSTHPRGHHHIVMTTDLLVTRSSPLGTRQEAIAAKPSRKLNTLRILEKLEIERQYWTARSTSWGIVTQHELPKALVTNLTWIAPGNDLYDFHVSEEQAAAIIGELFARITQDGQPLATTCTRTDGRLGLRAGTSLFLVRYALSTKQWQTDLSILIDPARALIVELAGKDSAIVQVAA